MNLNDSSLPTILVVDDLFGRSHNDGSPNQERISLCGQFLIQDISEDSTGNPAQSIKTPVARARFCRGQYPIAARVGDTVTNSVELVLDIVKAGPYGSSVKDESSWALILIDLCFYTGRVTPKSDASARGMPEGVPEDSSSDSYFGLVLLREIQAKFPHLPVALFSSMPKQEITYEYAVSGAVGFLPRDTLDGPELLRNMIFRHGLIPDYTNEMQGNSQSFLVALRAARRLARGRNSVLITGERGTGKELLARYIHKHGLRPSSSLINVDSGALNPEIFASLLFGHKKGAFTGAHTDSQGWIRAANGGDLFLDEIGNIPSSIQDGLLRVLQEKIVVPIGETKGVAVDVRFLFATNVDIQERAQEGVYRRDLIDRLREGGQIEMPPLRERLTDIPCLTEVFLHQAEKDTPAAVRRAVMPECYDVLAKYDWPGNIREFKQCIDNAVRDYPDMEYLLPSHLQFGNRGQNSNRLSQSTSKLFTSSSKLDSILFGIESIDFNALPRSELIGALPKLEYALTVAQGRCLSAALVATTRKSLDLPDGKVLIHPAVKFATGDATITASKAADIVKKVFSINERASALLLQDPVLAEANSIALKLRPKKTSKKHEQVN